MVVHRTRPLTGRRRRLVAALLMSAAMLASAPTTAEVASAQTEAPWRVRGKLLGKPRGSDVLDSKKAEDISGVACATDSGFPRLCIIADDEAQGVQIVILRDGEMAAGSFIPLVSDSHKGKPLELDAEGVAFAEGAFYVVGSHGRPRHNDTDVEKARSDAQAAASRRVFRIRIAPGAVDMATGRLTGMPEVAASTALGGFVQMDRRLGPWFDKPLEVNGLTV